MSDFILAIFVLIFFASDAPKTVLQVQIGINSVEVLLRVTLRDTSNFSEWFRSPRNFANICYISLLLLLSIIYFSYCGMYGTLRFTAVCTDKALNRNIFYYWDSRVLFAIMAIRALIVIRSIFVLRNFLWGVLPKWLQNESKSPQIRQRHEARQDLNRNGCRMCPNHPQSDNDMRPGKI